MFRRCVAASVAPQPKAPSGPGSASGSPALPAVPVKAVGGNMGVFVNFHEFSSPKKTETAVDLVIQGKFWKSLRTFELNLRGNLAEDLGFRHHREVFSPLCSPHFHSQLILGRSYSTILDVATVRGFMNGGYQARTYMSYLTYIATPKR